jgi:hypothetical protein
MSQRRSTTGISEKPLAVVVKESMPNKNSEPVMQSSLTLDNDSGAETEPLSVESRYQNERKSLRLKHWRESPFAVGLTEPTWMEERIHHRSFMHIDHDLPDDQTGCLCCSAAVCPLLGAGRVGNMAVLHSSTEWVEEIEEDEETGEKRSRRYTRPSLQCVVGPYWPMLAFVTYPLIIGVSWLAFKNVVLPGTKPLALILTWSSMTIGLIVALACTSCRDPGVLYRNEEPPAQNENNWRWSDQAQTYRPRNAHFDSDTMVVVEEFDHTYVLHFSISVHFYCNLLTPTPSLYRCPWTGTAIGKNNMIPFQLFVCLVFLCLTLDIFIITGAM